MSAGWYLKKGEKVAGPFSAAQLKTLAESGKLVPTDPVRHGNEGQWVAAKKVKGLFEEPPDAGSHRPAQKPATAKKAKSAPTPPAPPQRDEPAQDVFAMLADTAYSAPRARGGGKGESAEGDESSSAAHPSLKVRQLKEKQKRQQALLVKGVIGVSAAAIALTGLMFGFRWYQEHKDEFSQGHTIRDRLETAAKVKKEADKKAEEAEALEKEKAAKTEAQGATAVADARSTEPRLKASAGKVDVTFVSAEKGLIPAKQKPPALAKRQLLMVHLSLENKDAAKKVDFRPWSFSGTHATGEVRLVDELGNNYKQIIVQGLEGQPEPESSVYPGKSVNDILVFEPPVESAKALRLTLAAGRFGATGSLVLVFPAEKVAGDGMQAPAGQPAAAPGKARPAAGAMEDDAPPPLDIDSMAPKKKEKEKQ